MPGLIFQRRRSGKTLIASIGWQKSGPIGLWEGVMEEKGILTPPPGPPGCAGARLVRAEAVVTLLFTASLIPTLKPRFVPGELPRFPELLPLQKGGWGKTGTTGHDTGLDSVSSWMGYGRL